MFNSHTMARTIDERTVPNLATNENARRPVGAADREAQSLANCGRVIATSLGNISRDAGLTLVTLLGLERHLRFKHHPRHRRGWYDFVPWFSKNFTGSTQWPADAFDCPQIVLREPSSSAMLPRATAVSSGQGSPLQHGAAVRPRDALRHAGTRARRQEPGIAHQRRRDERNQNADRKYLHKGHRQAKQRIGVLPAQCCHLCDSLLILGTGYAGSALRRQHAGRVLVYEGVVRDGEIHL